MSAIREIKGRQIIDSRGNPTVEAEVTLESGAKAVRQSRPGPQRVRRKRLNCVMAIRSAGWARVCRKPWPISAR